MRTTWIFKLCAPLASAAVLIGCTQEVSDSQAQNRTAIDNATNQQRQDLRLAMTGCLGVGLGTNEYVLTHARPVPLAEQPSDALSSANITIPENTEVRLSSNDTDKLTELFGQTVRVQGLLKDDGRNTIGTSGRAAAGQNPPDPRTDKSQAAADEHYSDKVKQEAGPIGMRSMNNGTYPEMTVLEIEGTGQKCETAPAGEERR
jgi:hypothetical protein